MTDQPMKDQRGFFDGFHYDKRDQDLPRPKLVEASDLIDQSETMIRAGLALPGLYWTEHAVSFHKWKDNPNKATATIFVEGRPLTIEIGFTGERRSMFKDQAGRARQWANDLDFFVRWSPDKQRLDYYLLEHAEIGEVLRLLQKVQKEIGQYCGAVYAGGLGWYSIMSLPGDDNEQEKETQETD